MKTSFRTGLVKEVLGMAVGTLVSNRLRSALTILGVVIGVTSIVAMTSLIRGFGTSLENALRELGSETVYVQRFGLASFASGKDFIEVVKRPNLTIEDALAIGRSSDLVKTVGFSDGGGPFSSFERLTYDGQSTKRVAIIGATATFGEINNIIVVQGRGFTDYEVQHRRQVVVLGSSPAAVLFPNVDPLGKEIRAGRERYTVVGVFGERPAPLGGNPNDFIVIPYTTHAKHYPPRRFRGALQRFGMIAVVPREGVARDTLIREIEGVMRVRHGLKLDQENDFDIITADSISRIFDQFTRAIVIALVVISSIALMVGGIGVMAIMTISVTERTREIGVRKAIGARRREILWQFLIEAVFLTSIGGLLGIVLGSAIGLIVNQLANFPVSLPWWSFALGLGFSATVGILFGMLPAIKAARLDPIEALRYE
jgi:putative ABC transport system permease protein